MNTDTKYVNEDTITVDETPAQQYGWICPKCGSVWSPTTTGCTNCMPMRTTVSTTGTVLDITDY